MISERELNPHGYALNPVQAINFAELYRRLNVLRSGYARPMLVTSGVRSAEDQLRINPKAKNSMHIRAAAADISDPGGELWEWLMENMNLCETLGMWMEDRLHTPRWCHLQILPPKSGSRIFIP